MKMKEVASNIDFADSTYKSCEMKNCTLIILINAWDEKLIITTFLNVIGCVYKIGSFVSGIFENTEGSPFLDETLSLYYEKIPESHSFKSYSIMDIDDSKIFEVIAENVSVRKE